MATPKTHKITLIINVFAIAHVIATFIFQCVLETNDEIVLTILTLAMLYTIMRLYNTPVEVGTAMAIICCFAGYFIGTKGAEFLRATTIADIINPNLITTFVTTQILGWLTFLIIKTKDSKTDPNDSEKQ